MNRHERMEFIDRAALPTLGASCRADAARFLQRAAQFRAALARKSALSADMDARAALSELCRENLGRAAMERNVADSLGVYIP